MAETDSSSGELETTAPTAGMPEDNQQQSENTPSELPALLKSRGITLAKGKIRRLDEYCQLLWDWNSRLNLTRHTTYEKFVARDIVDSLALANLLQQGERVLDVGTGGGVPGIILAIVRPDLQVELCDSTGKKAMAVSEMVQALKLNVPVHHAKAEAVLAKRGKGTRFTTLTIRAVSKLADLLRMVGPYWTIFDRLLIIKGPKWPDERGEARHYNLLNKLALRCVDTYPTQISETETIDSVVLQVCRKDDFENLEKLINEHLAERPDPPREFIRRKKKSTKKRDF